MLSKTFFTATVIMVIYSSALSQYFSNSFFDSSLVDKPVLPFSMKTYDNKILSSKDLKGKVIVLDFWATWCKPCIMLTHELDSALKQYYDKDFIMIGVNFMENNKASVPIEYWKKKGYTFPMTLNNDNYGKSVGAGNPSVIVVDQEGNVRGNWSSWTTNGAKEISALVWYLMEKPEISVQQVVNANRNKEYIKALFIYDQLIKQDTSAQSALPNEVMRALFRTNEWGGVDFAKQYLERTNESIQALTDVAVNISETDSLTPKIYAYGAEIFEKLIAKDPTESGGSFIAYDLMGRCYYKSGNKPKAIEYVSRSLSMAKAIPDMSPLTIEYLEGVLHSYQL